ncbi:MAG: hypothetical protein GX025_09505 [Clostridiales bacterium]|nr:hypothetical protein [Clostridiales bacterium]
MENSSTGHIPLNSTIICSGQYLAAISDRYFIIPYPIDDCNNVVYFYSGILNYYILY